MSRLISLVNFYEMELQSIWWRDISKDPLFEPLQAKFQPERMHGSCLVVIWSEISAQKNALPSRQRAVPQVDRCNDKTTNWAMNWFLIHPILRIWSRVTLLLFPNLKTWFGGKKFSSNEEVIVAVNEYFADFETAYFKWLPNVNYASFLAEIWPERVRRVDIFRNIASSNGL